MGRRSKEIIDQWAKTFDKDVIKFLIGCMQRDQCTPNQRQPMDEFVTLIHVCVDRAGSIIPLEIESILIKMKSLIKDLMEHDYRKVIFPTLPRDEQYKIFDGLFISGPYARLFNEYRQKSDGLLFKDMSTYRRGDMDIDFSMTVAKTKHANRVALNTLPDVKELDVSFGDDAYRKCYVHEREYAKYYITDPLKRYYCTETCALDNWYTDNLFITKKLD
jgi:hypothetical protein